MTSFTEKNDARIESAKKAAEQREKFAAILVLAAMALGIIGTGLLGVLIIVAIRFLWMAAA
jgi:hypothetical protein